MDPFTNFEKVPPTVGPLVSISIHWFSGKVTRLDVLPDETLLNVKQKIEEREGIPSDKIKFFFAKYPLEDFNKDSGTPTTIQENGMYNGTAIGEIAINATWNPSSSPRTMFILPQKAVPLYEYRIDQGVHTSELPPGPESAKIREDWEKIAGMNYHDADLDIVDPNLHLQLSQLLERNVFVRSEYYQASGEYIIRTIFDLISYDQRTNATLMLPPWVLRGIEINKMKWMASLDLQFELDLVGDMLKSYKILLNVWQSLSEMRAHQYCGDSISILTRHSCEHIIELRQIAISQIERLKINVLLAIQIKLGNLDQYPVIPLMRHIILPPCKQILTNLGYDLTERTVPEAPQAALALLRKFMLLLDLAVVSFVRSHCFDFSKFKLENLIHKIPLKGLSTQLIEVKDELTPFAFRSYAIRLNCLDLYLDQQPVRVFEFSDPTNGFRLMPHKVNAPKMSLLTRMSDFAAIWGPVYTIRTPSGHVQCYVLSKGVIYRVSDARAPEVEGAVRCHYHPQGISQLQSTLDSLPPSTDVTLSDNDSLLIGGLLKENNHCEYSMSNFVQDMKMEIIDLGGKPPVWQLDSRSMSTGVSRILTVNISGTQKLVPSSTVKQRALAKWTLCPSTANPAIFNQSLGAEISQCTGNARRVSLKKMLTLDPFAIILRRQNPEWTTTPWGPSLHQTLQDDDLASIFRVWNDHLMHRDQIAKVLRCVLELLDPTGLHTDNKLYAAVFCDNDEFALPVQTAFNDWTATLKDTYTTAAYVLVHQVCLALEDSDCGISSCRQVRGHTVLETQIDIDIPCDDTFCRHLYELEPEGGRWKRIKCDTSTNILKPIMSPSFSWLHVEKPHVSREKRYQTRHPNPNTFHFRASKASFHGREKQKRIATIDSSISSSRDIFARPESEAQEDSFSREEQKSPTEGDGNASSSTQQTQSIWYASDSSPPLTNRSTPPAQLYWDVPPGSAFSKRKAAVPVAESLQRSGKRKSQDTNDDFDADFASASSSPSNMHDGYKNQLNATDINGQSFFPEWSQGP